MAKPSKKARVELDEALDHLGGGVAPIPPPKRSRRPAPRQKALKRKAKAKKR